MRNFYRILTVTVVISLLTAASSIDAKGKKNPFEKYDKKIEAIDKKIEKEENEKKKEKLEKKVKL
jgi:hypothetical protein